MLPSVILVYILPILSGGSNYMTSVLEFYYAAFEMSNLLIARTFHPFHKSFCCLSLSTSPLSKCHICLNARFCIFLLIFRCLYLIRINTSQHKFATKMSSPLKSGYNLTLFHKGLFLVKCNSTLKRQFQTLKRILHIINHFSSRL